MARPRPVGRQLRRAWPQGRERADHLRPEAVRPPHHLHLPGLQQQPLRPRLDLRQTGHAM